MEAITIREMLSEEKDQVLAMGRRAFHGYERLWVSKPKLALVAEREGKLAGAVLYKMMRAGDKSIGYVDYAFVDPVQENKGIGSVLYREAIAHLWELGCDVQAALVKDDNVGSWHLFEKNGYQRFSLPALVRLLGIGGALKLYLFTPYCVAIGMGCYVAEKTQEKVKRPYGSGIQLATFLLVNAFLMLLGKFMGGSGVFHAMGALLCMLLVGVVGEYIGTLFSRGRKWTFRFFNGGLLVSTAIMIVSVLPMIGRFYPDKYEKTRRFLRDMGVSSMMGWMALLVVTVVCVFLLEGNLFVRNMGMIGIYLLLYRCIPIYPFESFGGRRLLNWSQPVFWVMMTVSLVTVIRGWIS